MWKLHKILTKTQNEFSKKWYVWLSIENSGTFQTIRLKFPEEDDKEPEKFAKHLEKEIEKIVKHINQEQDILIKNKNVMDKIEKMLERIDADELMKELQKIEKSSDALILS